MKVGPVYFDHAAEGSVKVKRHVGLIGARLGGFSRNAVPLPQRRFWHNQTTSGAYDLELRAPLKR
jgi:hypothetical protein